MVRYRAFLVLDPGAKNGTLGSSILLPWVGQRGDCQVRLGSLRNDVRRRLEAGKRILGHDTNAPSSSSSTALPPSVRELTRLGFRNDPARLIARAFVTFGVFVDGMRSGKPRRELCRSQVRRCENANLTRRFSFALTSFRQLRLFPGSSACRD